jgi:TonB family protein
MSSARAAQLLEVKSPRKILTWSLITSFALEALVLTIAGWNGHWLAHPQKPNDESGFIEAQIFQVPKESHLVEVAEKAKVVVRHAEPVLSKAVNQGREAKPDEGRLPEQNQTDASGTPSVPTHGPVAIFAPPPKIPNYLQDQDLNTNVVIEFLVSAQGQSTPRLIGSSGNEELDAIAIETAHKWQFRPAEKDHKAVDSKVRLRIVFEVK